MNDVTGMPQSAVVLGGTSELALALVRRLCARRLRRIVLAGRDIDALGAAADELRALGAEQVETGLLDVRETAGIDAFATDAARRLDGVDLVVVAVGLLGTAELDELDADAVANSIATNFTGPAAATLAFAQVMRRQGYGKIVVFSSVAGVRVRRSNFVYGAGKAGLDGFCQGLRDSLEGTGVEVVIVRPGFVHTKMTAGRAAAPMSVGAEDVATAVVSALEKGTATVWVPGALAYVFTALRHLPGPLWRRLPG